MSPLRGWCPDGRAPRSVFDRLGQRLGLVVDENVEDANKFGLKGTRLAWLVTSNEPVCLSKGMLAGLAQGIGSGVPPGLSAGPG